MTARIHLRSFLSISLAVVGCSDPAPQGQTPTTEGAHADPAPQVPAPPPAPTVTLEQAAAQRTSHIAMRCLNRPTTTLRRIREHYLRRANREDGPQRLDAIAGGIFYQSPSEAPDCRTAIDEAIAMQPAVPEFDEPARRYIEALEAAVPVITDASNYYTRQTYDDDRGVHARELHGSLLRVLDAFVAADDALGNVAAAAEQRALDARVAELASDPAQRGLYLVERTRACASRTTHTITKLEVQPADATNRAFHLSGGDAAALMTSLTECQTIIDEMVAAPETATVDTGGSYRADANRFIGAALIAARALRDDTRFSHPAQATRLLDDAIGGYNSLVDDYNRL